MACDYDSFLGFWGITYLFLRAILVGSIIVIVSCVIENNLVILGAILAESMIVIVSWAVGE